MKKPFKMIIAFAVLAAMCLSFGTQGLAAGQEDVSVSAVLSAARIELGGQDGTVDLTVKMSSKCAIDSAEFTITSDIPGLTAGSPSGTPSGITSFDADYKAFAWMASGDDVETEALATFTLTIPADTAAGIYSIGFEGLNISTSMDLWMEEGSDSARLEVAGTASGPQFAKHSLVLSGEIGVNFFMELPGEPEDYEGSCVEFTVGDRVTECPFDPQFRDKTGSLYGFTCHVNSIQMADNIHASFSWGGETAEQDYSVAQYVEEFRGVSGDFDAKTSELVEALADYGHFVQPFLAESNGWTVGVEHAAMDVNSAAEYTQEQKAEAADGLKKYEISRDCSGSGIDKVLFSLTLDSATGINLYMEPAEGFSGKVTYSINDGSELSAGRSGGEYRIRIKGISAHRLGEEFRVAVSAGGGFTVKVSALSYANALLNSEKYGTQDSAVNAATALYRYCKAAEAYNSEQ